METEEIEKLFRELKRRFELGAISEEEYRTRIDGSYFRDDGGRYWTIGARTEEWFRHDDIGWVHASPPATLDPVTVESAVTEEPAVADESAPPSVEEEPAAPALPRRRPRPVVLGLSSLLLALVVLAVAVVSFQLGRLSVASIPAEGGAGVTHTSTPAGTRTAATIATASDVATGETPSPSPGGTQQEVSVTPTPGGGAAPPPTATPIAAHVVKYPPPVLLGPENGVERGPGYEARLTWAPVGQLAPDEYYHVEACWNGCNHPDDFWGSYPREPEYLFPDFLRGRAIDDRYYWHVTVRVQTGESRAVPPDPAVSPPSETWAFKLPRE